MRPIATPRARSSSPAGALTWGTAIKPTSEESMPAATIDSIRASDIGSSRSPPREPSRDSPRRRPRGPLESAAHGTAGRAVRPSWQPAAKCLSRAGSARSVSRTPTVRLAVAMIRSPCINRARVLVVPPSKAIAHVQGLRQVGCKSAMFFAFSLPLRPGRAILRQNETQSMGGPPGQSRSRPRLVMAS